ncbi:hypothetical protein [Haloarchaeobius sp. HME9146]|uniref:DUF7344 domain-containing protein n=1 Tax=Haloarchaeobius sp. HME9146 TaxID=2978732 RepID=UPI0021C1C62B|nr:hypothetical protein [Haloarchaeobius sp. HME9146]MCT9096959.1 hypothetical protein [Haloarchaeobius sp. HME9146]
MEEGQSTTLREIARYIAAIEHGVPRSQATGEIYHRVYSSLDQAHLHKLAEAKIIEIDSRGKTITPGQNIPKIGLILRILETLLENVNEK